jgi:hypothetical protein
MYPERPIDYYTDEYVDPLIELLANAETMQVLNVLWYTMPKESPGHVRVMNLRTQFIEAEERRLDGLGGWKKDKRRINGAMRDVLDKLRVEYPYYITLRYDRKRPSNPCQ